MAQSTSRVLFVATDLPPFTELSSISDLAQSLPVQVQDAGDYEVRVMMPCYGNINEREHSLHEVIRLSGTDVPMGSDTESVRVKVASPPNMKAQVYFMDHDEYFDRNGQMTNGDGEQFADNPRRALFFSRAVLETIRKLRWGPDVIHSVGSMSGLLHALLETTYADEELFASAKSIFTPDEDGPATRVESAFSSEMGLALDGSVGSTVSEIGVDFADATVFPPDGSPVDGAEQFSNDPGTRSEQLAVLYDQMLGEVPA